MSDETFIRNIVYCNNCKKYVMPYGSGNFLCCPKCGVNNRNIEVSGVLVHNMEEQQNITEKLKEANKKGIKIILYKRKMTEEEMANEYAKKNKNIYGSDEYAYITDYINIKKAYLAGLEAGKDMAETDIATVAYMQRAERYKPKWHKVADGNLPKDTGEYLTNIGVLIWDYYADGRYGWHTENCKFCDCCDDIDSDEVIAWCEIPKYTEE